MQTNGIIVKQEIDLLKRIIIIALRLTTVKIERIVKNRVQI